MRRYADETVEIAVRTGHDAPELTAERRPASGARSGALMAVASLVAIVLNYAFLLAAGRFLGLEDYGALAALMGLLTVVLLPTGAIQMAVSRDVARELGTGDVASAETFSYAVLRLSALAAVPILGVALALAWPMSLLLDLELGLVALAMLGLGSAFLLPAGQGVLQGYQRFRALAALYVFPFLLRLVLLGVAMGAGLRLGGAIAATVAAVLVTAAVVVVSIRSPLLRGAVRARPSLVPFVRYLVPVSVGLIGLAVLTNIDILVVRARFSPEDAGVYAAASAFARVAFFLPATILAVLFPRTAARQARGQQTDDILGRALLVAGAFSVLLALAYVLTGEGLVVSSFGPEFADAGALLPAYALAMGLYAIVNVLAGYHLSRGETRYAWIVASAIPVNLVALALVPGSLEGVIWTNALIAAGLIAVHELTEGSSLPALRAGASHLVPEPLALRLRHIAREGGLALVGYGGLALLITWPLSRGLGSTFIGDERNDAAGTIGWLWRVSEEGGYHLFGASTHTLTGAPFGWEEGNALNLQWLVPYYPASLLSEATGEVAAYNLVILSGLVLSAVSMYALTRYLGCRPLVATWAGVAYMLLPWLVWRVNAGHASLAHVWVLTLVVLALVAWTRRPSIARSALVGAAVTAAWLTSGYFGAMSVIGVIAYVLAASLVRLRDDERRALLRQAAMPVGAVVLGTLVLGLLTVPGRLEGVALNPRDVSSLEIYGARPLEFVTPDQGHPVLGSAFAWLRPGLHSSNVAETSLYLGWLALALAVGWLVFAFRQQRSLSTVERATMSGLVATGLAGFGFSLASPLELFGWEIRMPSWLLFQVLTEARVPSRFMVLVAVVVIPLAALGLQALTQRVRGPVVDRASTRRVQLVVVLALGVTLFELLPSLGKPLEADAVPAPYRALEELPAGVLAEYPMGPPGTNASLEYALRQRVHERPLLNGARVGSFPDDVRRALVDPTAAGTAEALALLGVPAVITRGDGRDWVKGIPEPGTARLGAGYELVRRFPDDYALWRVTAEPAPALVTLSGGDFRDSLLSRGTGARLVLRGDDGDLEFAAKNSGTVLLTFDVVNPGSSRSTLRIVGVASERTTRVDDRARVTIAVAIPRGRSRLSLRVLTAGSKSQQIHFGPPRAYDTIRAAELRATPVDDDPGF